MITKRKILTGLNIVLILILSVLLSSCKLFDLIQEAVLNNGRKLFGKTYATILVMPPFPNKMEGTNEIQQSFTFSRSVEDGLNNGLKQYNEKSKSTQVDNVYLHDPSLVIKFYRKLFANNDKYREYCKEQLNIAKIQNGTDASCIICGIYNYSEYATHTQVRLYYYDAAKDITVWESASIPLEDGRDRQSRLEDLMTALLKKAYHK